MSRIFDALQRSESEWSESDGHTLPGGPELLQRAERRMLSKLNGGPSAQEDEVVKGQEGNNLSGPEAVGSSTSEIPAPAILGAWSQEERLTFLGQVKSASVSLAAESRLVCLTDRDCPTAEAIRLLSVRLRDLRRTRPLKKVLVTSSIPREGKTTVCANLACALADGSKERTLLIEGDVRLPALRQLFGVERMHGICELVQDGRRLPECLHHLDGAGVWLLPAGRVPTNPLETLQSPKLPGAMNQLAACFDWIVIDSPPVLPLADTSVWMRLADGILLVARQGTTEKQQLQRGLEALEPEKVIGALLNSATASTYSGYYYRSSASS
jgi:capsular exopolysaccharide synthesis family protein